MLLDRMRRLIRNCIKKVPFYISVILIYFTLDFLSGLDYLTLITQDNLSFSMNYVTQILVSSNN